MLIHPCQLVLTGGGTSGHVLPNLPLIAQLKDEYQLAYIGSKNGFEVELVKDIPYYAIQTGKWRRYLTIQNITDQFRTLYGIWQAWRLLGRLKPKLVFSKGGYVALPVVLAAKLRRIPVISHESDTSPGIVTRVTARFATEVWSHYQAAIDKLKKQFPKPIYKQRSILVRQELYEGEAQEALEITGLTPTKKTILVACGSQGAESVNLLIDRSRDLLLKNGYQIIHICGREKMRNSTVNYYTIGYAKAELPHFYALADLIIGRAGATSLAEWALLNKPVILCPLGGKQSRGEQHHNALHHLQANQGEIMEEDDTTPEQLLQICNQLLESSDSANKADNTKQSYAKLINEYTTDIREYLNK